MKTQILTFVIGSAGVRFRQPVYCPFTGEKLIHEDPFNDSIHYNGSINEYIYPSSVIALWSNYKILFKEIHYFNKRIYSDLNADFFENIETIEELAKLMDHLESPSGYLIIDVQIRPNHPGSYQKVFLLRRPYFF
jgi:hypothetical protein